MSHPATRHPPLSLEEYLRLEETSTVKHEYVAGEIHAMVGATKRHNRIAGNITALLWSAARGGPCRVYTHDVKLRAAEDVVYYPDVMVACDSDSGHPLIEDAPCVVVEVLSPSTETTDRREKTAAYKRMAGMRAYFIVHQARRRVKRHWRDEHGTWWHDDAVGRGSVVFPCPEIELSLEEIYERLDIPE
ncbi:MAG: Uma2 family endonuclease [Gemmatimonadetes bacterium]|nr:Uma2 family endonuclease [Gemmatimonadota bacterium]